MFFDLFYVQPCIQALSSMLEKKKSLGAMLLYGFKLTVDDSLKIIKNPKHILNSYATMLMQQYCQIVFLMVLLTIVIIPSEVVVSDGIEPLINLLGGPKALVQANAAVCLTNLAADGEMSSKYLENKDLFLFIRCLFAVGKHMMSTNILLNFVVKMSLRHENREKNKPSDSVSVNHQDENV